MRELGHYFREPLRAQDLRRCPGDTLHVADTGWLVAERLIQQTTLLTPKLHIVSPNVGDHTDSFFHKSYGVIHFDDWYAGLVCLQNSGDDSFARRGKENHRNFSSDEILDIGQLHR